VTKIVACSLLFSLGLALSLPPTALAENAPQKNVPKSMKAYQKQQKKQLKKTQKDQRRAQAKYRKLHPEAR
jgi:hypothetical protein